MEFGLDPGSKITIFPRGMTYKGRRHDEKPSFTWNGKYGFVGMNLLDQTMSDDGINEEGLYAGLLYLPGLAEYQEVPKGQENKSISQLDVITYILSNCASVEEAKILMQNVLVYGVYEELVKSVPGVHFTVHDPSGKSAVFEYVKGKLNIYDNPLGVITNMPTFDWHLINLRNYINLSATGIPKLELDGDTLTQLSQGTGMLGLPGDSTSPSRFIRALALTQSALKPENAEKAINLTYHIMNNFDIPLGFSRSIENGQNFYDYTFWTTISDLNNKTYYYRGYDNLKVYRVDLKKIDFQLSAPRSLDTQNSDWFEEVS